MKLPGVFKQPLTATWVPQALALPISGGLSDNLTTILMAMGPPSVTNLAESIGSATVSLRGRSSFRVVTNLLPVSGHASPQTQRRNAPPDSTRDEAPASIE